MGRTLMENHNGLIVNATPTLGADEGYDAAEFIAELQEIQVTPHLAQNKSGRRSAVPDEIAQTEGCGMSMPQRKRIEQGFG